MRSMEDAATMVRREVGMSCYVEGQGQCRTCNRAVLTRKRSPNHVLHLLLVPVTFGVWAFVWLFLGISSNSNPARCAGCGGVV